MRKRLAETDTELTIEARLFFVSMISGCFASFMTILWCVFCKMNYLVLIIIASFYALLFSFTIIGWITRRYTVLSNIGVIALNFVFFPIAYSVIGGKEFGAAVYFVLAIFMCSATLKGKSRIVITVLSILVFSGMIVADHTIVPDIELTDEAKAVSNVFSFATTSVMVCYITVFLRTAYLNEQNKTNKLMKSLEYTAVHDLLTGLYNRGYLVDYLDRNLGSITSEGYIAIWDFDSFKSVNDTYGHVFGDEVLQYFSKIMLDTLEESSIVARYGGEEFVCFIKSDDEQHVIALLEKVRKHMEKTHWVVDDNLMITVSCGVCRITGDADCLDIISYADKKLYEAKNSGKNKVVY